MRRKSTIKVKVGNVFIGGNSPVSVQSMCNTNTTDTALTIKQIKELQSAGCDIVRLAIPDEKSAKAMEEIRKQTNVALVADIHFDYKLALICAPFVDKLRINPGNIGNEENIKAVIDACKKYNLPIRIGVNSGSIENDLLKLDRVQGMVQSALRHVKILEKNDFFDMVISIKSSDVNEMIQAYRLISQKVKYPLHVGVTEAGTSFSGTIKSSIGIGALLSEGIGDTIRVSLTENPVQEVKVGIEILKALGYKKGRTIISCPTCARTQIDIISLAKEVEKRTQHIKEPITIAVMGCVVNGPGEASHANYGVAGGKGVGIIFKNGKIFKKVKETEIVEELTKVIEDDIRKN